MQINKDVQDIIEDIKKVIYSNSFNSLISTDIDRLSEKKESTKPIPK